jgi:hypothetical protein
MYWNDISSSFRFINIAIILWIGNVFLDFCMCVYETTGGYHVIVRVGYRNQVPVA